VAVFLPHTADAQRRGRLNRTKKKPTKKKSSTTPVDSAKDPYPFKCRKQRGKVWVRFREEVELKDLITWAMGFTCRNFIYGSGIVQRAPKVRIISPVQMTPWQAWRIFLVSLQTMNLTVVPKGNVLKVIETRQSKDDSLPLYRRGRPSSTDQMVRLILRPKHIAPDELERALNLLKSKVGTVKSLSAAGVVVVSDYGSHIAKMSTMIRELDQPLVGERVYMIKVRHADVQELATKLQEILGTKDKATPTRTTRRPRRRRGRRGRRTPTQRKNAVKAIAIAKPSKIIADERTNSLIVLASKPAYLRVRGLVKRLDIAIEVEGAGRIHVYYLNNADAEELAGTLTTVISGITSSRTTTRGRTNTRNTRNRRTPTRRTPTRPGVGGAQAFEGNVRVTHDKPTNSLVVVASIKDFISLRRIINKLDTPRRQVFIEAVIAEVKVDNSRDLGVSFHGGSDLDDGAILLGGLQHQNLQSLNVASLATQSGLIGGAIGPLLPNAEQLLGTSIPSFGLLFQALATNSNVNVLSSPHILTTDNEEAEISVGENIPYQSSLTSLPGGAGGAGGAGGFGFPVQSIQRQDVALTLKITPHINASDMVRLEIDQEISDIASPNFGGLGPSWAKRTIKTTVVVRDEQSVVIGGLMAERETYSESKIPLLGDVPILGYLFKYTQKSKSKTNLLILLTPYVVKDQMDIEQIVQRKVRERNEFLRSFSNLRRMNYTPHMDYRRKRGLVEEINRAVKNTELEAELIRASESKQDLFKDGPVNYDEDIDGPEDKKDDAKKPDTKKADDKKAPKKDNKKKSTRKKAGKKKSARKKAGKK